MTWQGRALSRGRARDVVTLPGLRGWLTALSPHLDHGIHMAEVRIVREQSEELATIAGWLD